MSGTSLVRRAPVQRRWSEEPPFISTPSTSGPGPLRCGSIAKGAAGLSGRRASTPGSRRAAGRGVTGHRHRRRRHRAPEGMRMAGCAIAWCRRALCRPTPMATNSPLIVLASTTCLAGFGSLGGRVAPQDFSQCCPVGERIGDASRPVPAEPPSRGRSSFGNERQRRRAAPA